MPDINREASEFWNSLKPMIDEEIKAQTRGMVQRRKMKVTTAPSLNTNNIGVTEPFGTEMLIPFTTNLISATVGDVVWVEFMYGMTNAFASMFASADEKDWDVAGNLSVIGNAGIGGNLGVLGATSLQNTTVNGVLDITPRRCYGTLVSEGWYRVCAISFNSYAEAIGASGGILRFAMTDSYSSYPNDAHTINLLLAHNKVTFADETSVSNALEIDKIRYTFTGTSPYNGYVDIHFLGRGGTTYVGISFDYTGIGLDRQARVVAQNLQSVAASPSGETVMTEYTFAANTNVELPVTYVSNSYVNSAAVSLLHFWIRGDVIVCLFNLAVSTAMATGTDFVKICSVALPRNLPNGFYATIPAQNGSGTLLVQIATNGDISIANASGTTASGFYRTTFSFVMV